MSFREPNETADSARRHNLANANQPDLADRIARGQYKPAKGLSTASGPLLTPELLTRLERLELVSRKIFRGRIKGERRSKRKGQSVEFADFRNYVAGDDLRLIDWNLYARLDQLFLKMFLEEEDLHFHALVDASASMQFGDPSKWRVAAQLAASLGYIGLCRADRVRVAALGPDGRRAPVMRGKAGFRRMTQYLESIDVDDDRHNVSLLDGVRDFAMRNAGSGVVVLITDLLDKTGYESALRLLVGRRMDVFVLHVLAPEEIDPPISGDRRLIDVEDGDATEITISPYIVQRYKKNVTAFCESAKAYCSQRDVVYIPVRTDIAVETIVSQYLRRRGVVR